MVFDIVDDRARALATRGKHMNSFTAVLTALHAQPINRFLASNPELQKYKLGAHEWEALESCRKVLAVRSSAQYFGPDPNPYLRYRTLSSSDYRQKKLRPSETHCQPSRRS